MRSTLASLAALLTATFLLMSGAGLLGTLLSLRLGQSTLPTLVVGSVMAAFYLGVMLGTGLAQRVVTRVGHIRAFASFATVYTAAILGHGLFDHPAVWAGLRLLCGICTMGLYIVLESWLNERAAAQIRGRVFAAYMVVSYSGLTLGQFLLGLDTGGPEIFMLAAVLAVLCVVPIALTRAAHPSPVETAGSSIRELVGLAPFGLLAGVVAGLLGGATFAMAAASTSRSGLDVGAVSVFMGVLVASGLLLQFPIGWVSDRRDRGSVLEFLSIASVVVATGLWVAAELQPTLLPLLGALFGGFALSMYPVASAYISDRVPGEKLVQGSAALLFAYGAGATLGPIGGAISMSLLGPSALWLFCAVAASLLVLGMPWRRRMRRREVEAQSRFVMVTPRASTVIYELDPRSEVGGSVGPDGVEQADEDRQQEAEQVREP